MRLILKLDNRAHIGNQELEKAVILKVPDRVKVLKLDHLFKIKKKTCSFLNKLTNFQILNEEQNILTAKTEANNFNKPRMYTNIFAKSALADWVTLPNNIKGKK